MISSLFSLVAALAALAPGLAYLHAYRRFALHDARSDTAEIVEMLAAGTIGTTCATLVVLSLGQLVPGLLTLRSLSHGRAGLGAAPWAAVISAALILLLSGGLCALGGRLLGHRAPQRVGRIREGGLYVRALTKRSGTSQVRPFLAVELTDGRLAEGYLWMVSVEGEGERRDIALQAPIAWSRQGEQRRQSEAARVVIPASMIQVIHISYPSITGAPSSATAPPTS